MRQIPGLDMEVKLIPIGVACAVALLLAQANISVIFTGGVGKNGSTVAVRLLQCPTCCVVESTFLSYLPHFDTFYVLQSICMHSLACFMFDFFDLFFALVFICYFYTQTINNDGNRLSLKQKILKSLSPRWELVYCAGLVTGSVSN